MTTVTKKKRGRPAKKVKEEEEEEVELTEEEEEEAEQNDDDKFVDSLIQIKAKNPAGDSIAGLKLRPPTLATLAILNRADNALITGSNLTESEVIMHVLVFMYVHHAEIEEVHGASLMASVGGQNLTMERKALELGETLPYKKPEDFIKLYEELMAWLGSHMDLKVEPIPDDKGSPPNPNE
jgi:hypothetical protein